MAHLIIRADGDLQMGTGHLMRLLSFAQFWLDGGDPVTFLTASCDVLRDRFENEGIEIVDIQSERASRQDGLQTQQLAEEVEDAVLMVDGPHFEDEFFETLRERSFPLVQVDDMGRLSEYHADVVLNQNLHATDEMYESRSGETRLCMGVEYILFRREIRRASDEKRRYSKTLMNVLVTMGGSDPSNATLAVLQVLEGVMPEGGKVVVPVGAANPHIESLQNWAASTSLNVELVRNVREMSPLLLAADIAISSGGTTVWELAMFGVPTLVGVIADIENYLVEGLRSHELFRLAGDFRSMDRELLEREFSTLVESSSEREKCGKHAAAFIDGLGVERLRSLCQRLNKTYKSNQTTD